MKKTFVLLACALSSSCMMPPKQPVPQDPFAGFFDSAPPAFPNLNAAVFMSENSGNAARFGLASANLLPGGAPAMSAMLENGINGLTKNFKSAVRIDKLADAAKSGADVVIVVDFQADGRANLGFKDTLIFMTPEGRTLDTVKAEGSVAVSMLNPMGSVQQLNQEVQEKLVRGVRDSAALAELAKSKQASGVAAAAARIYHSDVDKPSYALDPSPNDFALVIGIEKYQSLPPADFAERDAAAVRAHLLALGYPEANIIYLTGAKASRTGLEKHVETWLPLNVKEDSRLFVYFSGHGAPDPNTSQAYLVPWDGDAKYLKDTAYPIKRLYERLSALKARQVILAMDSCFSGAGGRSVLAKGARPLVAKVDTGLAGPGKLVVFSASSADEITSSAEAQGHGLFTYHFLKGLSEKGGRATVSDLYAYLLPKVQDGAHRDGREQTPTLMPAELGEKASLELR